MTREPAVSPEGKFVPALLPWLVAAGALVVYLVTLNPWVSFNNLGQGNLPQVARVSGWLWQADLYGPLNWLVTYPFRWLPAPLIPLALNGFAALCGGLTLALLARSVSLLPHDRTHQQRLRVQNAFSLLTTRTAWLPPVLAAVVCGLQLTFWEHATTASSSPPLSASIEMFDLLLFAYVIRCLLEFRIDERESWLTRAALVYALGITDNWAMIGFFPAFLMALVWIRGVNFFNVRFLVRMFLWGLAGLSLYLLLPLVQSLADIARVPFWPALKANLLAQKYALGSLYSFFSNSKQEALLLALTSVLPVFLIGIRWASYFGDTSRLGVTLSTLTFHIVNGLFLVVCTWVALDPPFSPHSQGFQIPFLTFHYLGALSVGYFSGYFLLVFGVKPERPWRGVAYPPLVARSVTGGIWLLLVVAAAALLYRNLPQIRTTNGPMFRQYAAFVQQDLRAPGVLLSDDARRLLLMQAAVTRSSKTKDFLLLDSASLKWPDYHRFLKRKYRDRWPVDMPKGRQDKLEDLLLVGVVSALAQSNSVFYLHPSFGYYFEFFYPEPHGLVYKLNPYPTNVLFAPSPSHKLLAENEAFWTGIDQSVLKPLVAAITPPNPTKSPGLVQRLMDRAHLTSEPNRAAAVLGTFYSRDLNFWGVEMQKSGQLAQAAAHFERAQELNPYNIVAEINLGCNHNLVAGRRSTAQLSPQIQDEFGRYRDWEQVVGENGPFDEPNFCYEQGRVFVRGGNYRQATHEFARVKTLAPENLPARLWLAQLYVLSRRPGEALKLVDEIHAQPELLSLDRTNQPELLSVEAQAHLVQGDLRGAEGAVQTALAKYPSDETLVTTATQVYMKFGLFSNAVALLDRQLKTTPDSLYALVNKGYACLQIGAFQEAIPALTRVLQLETNTASEWHNSALLNRAICYLRSDQLDDAQRDYEALQKAFPTFFPAHYGLGEVAYRKKDTNAAIRSYQLYLATVPTNAPDRQAEIKLVRERLAELRPGSP